MAGAPEGNKNAVKKKKDTSTVRIEHRCKKTEQAAWKKAAKAEGFDNLSSWIKATLNKKATLYLE